MNIQSIRVPIRKYKRGLGLVLCLLVAGFFSIYKLSESPGTWFDEGIFIQIARNASANHSYVFRVSPTEVVPAGLYTTVGFPVIAPISISFRLFGVGLLQARWVMVAFILLMVAALYLFAYSVWGFRVAMWSTLLVATHAPVYGNGKNVLGEVPGLFFFFALLFLASRLERERRATALWIVTGFVAGMFMATKPNFLLLLPVLLIAVALCRKQISFTWKRFLYGVIATAIPLAAYVITTFGFSTSLATIFSSYGNMPGLQAVTGLTLPALIQKNVLRFFHESTPAYVLVTYGVWLGYALLRLRKKSVIPFHEYVALGFSAATILYFLKMPGFYRYLFMAQVITFPYFVSSCFKAISSVRSIALWRRFHWGIVHLFSAMIVFQVYLLLFNSWAAGSYQGTRSKELTEYFQQLDPKANVFFYHVPEAVTFFPRENYFQYFQVIYFNDAVGKGQLANLENGAADVVVVSGSLEADALPMLGAYRRDREIDGGRYVVYTRK